MHVSSDVLVAERIFEHPIGPTNPASIEGVIPVIEGGGSDLDGLEILGGIDDGLGDSGWKHSGVARVDAAAEATHGRGCGVSVSGRDHHVFSGDSCRFRSDAFRLIEEIPRNHAAIDDTESDAVGSVVEREGFGEQGVDDFIGRSFGEHGVHDHREMGGGDIDDRSTCLEGSGLTKEGMRGEAEVSEQSQEFPKSSGQ